MMMTIDQK